MFSIASGRDYVTLNEELRETQAGIVEELGFRGLADQVREGDVGLPEAGRLIVTLEHAPVWKKDTILEAVVKSEETAAPRR